jgi:hypothetical protein
LALGICSNNKKEKGGQNENQGGNNRHKTRGADTRGHISQCRLSVRDWIPSASSLSAQLRLALLVLQMSSPRGEFYLWHNRLEVDTEGDKSWVTG